MAQDLRRIAIHKTFGVLGVMMIAFPLLKWWVNHNISFLSAILAPVPLATEFTVAAMMFVVLWYRGRCPQCKQSWSYYKMNEVMIPDQIGVSGEADRIGPLVMTSVAAEYHCSHCGLSRVIKRKKLMIKES